MMSSSNYLCGSNHQVGCSSNGRMMIRGKDSIRTPSSHRLHDAASTMYKRCVRHCNPSMNTRIHTNAQKRMGHGLTNTLCESLAPKRIVTANTSPSSSSSSSSSSSPSPSPSSVSKSETLLERITLASDSISQCFPLFVALASTIALLSPSVFSWFNGTMLILGLMFTMTSMGTTLSPSQLLDAIRSGREIVTGFCLQYSIMPLLGMVVSKVMHLSPEHTAGLILVSCCPGGVASNVVCYIAKANVALSVALTSVSTIAAVIMTPLLTSLLLEKSVQVDAMALFGSTVKVVLLPVLIGSLLSQKAPKFTSGIAAVAPAVSVLAVVFINASVVAQSSASIIATGMKLILACMMLHTGGFFLGYAISKYVLKLDESTCRTMSVEVGMQNSTLGAFLAVNHFSVLAAAPCAVSAVFHSGIGSCLAYYWGAKRMGSETPEKE